MQISPVVQVWRIRNETSLSSWIWSTVPWLICRSPSWHRFISPHDTHNAWRTGHSPHEAAVCGIGSMTFSPPKIGHHTDSLHPSKANEIYLATLASKNNSQNQPHKADITSHSSKSLCWFNFGITFQRFVRHTTDQAAGLASRRRGVVRIMNRKTVWHLPRPTETLCMSQRSKLDVPTPLESIAKSGAKARTHFRCMIN